MLLGPTLTSWWIIPCSVLCLHAATAAFWPATTLYEELFSQESLALLRVRDAFPPAVAIYPLSLSGWRTCRVEGYLHALEIRAVAGVKKFASRVCDFSEAAVNASCNLSDFDIVVVPHCFGNRMAELWGACNVQVEERNKPFGCWNFAKGEYQPFFRAWVGALRRVGQKALVFLSSMTARLLSRSFAQIPRVVSYLGSSQWLDHSVHGFRVQRSRQLRANRSLFQEYSCGHSLTTAATGDRTFSYPGVWSGDVVVQAPGQFGRSLWRPAGGRDLLQAMVLIREHGFSLQGLLYF
eukprot:TRINITY_DN71017_c0_g1_i2.p1 TRINITY_DN71017_c0_g1~~TRINITY_DN71017_c0_g1_i2.p1  ORF type:complete len:294 (-),score=28.85 TRINITY_DN71017_c0_g1_i2:2-883(-)